MDNRSTNDERLVATKGSLIQSINSFEKSLLNMKSTVLVPTRLNDLNCDKMIKNGINKTSDNNENLFDVYTDLQKMRKILFGDKSGSERKKSNRNEINGNENDCENLNGVSLKKDKTANLEFHAKHIKTLLDELCGTADYISNIYKDDIQNMHISYNIEFNNPEIKHYYTSNPSD